MSINNLAAVNMADSLETNLDQAEVNYLTESDSGSGSQLSRSAEQTDLEFNKAVLREYILSHKSDGEDIRLAQQATKEESNKIIDQAREYQQELFERAKEENIIAVLDTGSGKTLIAALLIRHYLQEEIVARSQDKPAKIIFFLVNSVHLARQQARFLSTNLPQKVIPLFGDSSEDLWKKADWSKIFADNSVVVCTPAVLESCLWHKYLTIGHISLIVFDEAH